jgi:hypothetical protein
MRTLGFLMYPDVLAADGSMHPVGRGFEVDRDVNGHPLLDKRHLERFSSRTCDLGVRDVGLFWRH